MWRASGALENKRPTDWLAAPSAREFVEFIGENVNAEKSGIEIVRTIRGGTNPGTWAHWQVAMAYAKYLSPSFHAWSNDVVRAHMQGRASSNDGQVARAVEGLALIVREFKSELAVVRGELGQLKAQVAQLPSHEHPYGGIGPAKANEAILSRLRAAAELLAGARKTPEYRRTVGKLNHRLAKAIGWVGKRIDFLPASKLGEANEEISKIEREAADVARVRQSARTEIALAGQASFGFGKRGAN
jgi:hypothetical protein